ncbi:MAG: PEGA domain-containing protein [bacterium]
MDNCPHCGKPIKEKYKMCSACGTFLITLRTETSAHINLLRKKIESDPKDVKLRIELGGLYQKNGLLLEALDEYKIAIGIDPNNFDAHNKSALIYLKNHELNDAEKSFRSALHIAPNSEEPLIGLFRVYYLQNKIIEALALGEKILKIKPDSVEFHMLMKNLYKQKGDKEKTFHELQKLESLIPDNVEVIKEIVQYFTDQNDMERLIKYYRKMEEMKIDDIQLGFMIGKYYYDNGEYDKADEFLNSLLVKENISEEMMSAINCYLTLAKFDNGDLSGAEYYINRIPVSQVTSFDEETRRKLASIFYKIGDKHLKEKKSKNAVLFFEKAVEYDHDAIEYKEMLEKTRIEVEVSTKNFIRKTISISIGAVAIVIFILLIWTLVRNKIVIYVEPATDVLVSIDGKKLDTQSKKAGVFESSKMFMGSHTIVIEKAGYERWQTRVNIGFGRNAVVRASLVPLYGVFQVNSEPESANVYLDGELVGKTPYVSGNILLTPHKVEIVFPGYQVYTRNIALSEHETLDLGMIVLKNPLGTWIGKIGEDGITYNASFKMTIKEKNGQLTVKFQHQPTAELTYNGEIPALLIKDDFLADGAVNCKERNVFYWTTKKKRVILKGKLFDDWERIEGKCYTEGLGEKNWWAKRER